MKVMTVSKQPGEKRRWGIDYTEALDEGDAVESVSSVVSPTGLDALAVPASPRVRLSVSGGTTGTTYKITLTVTTTNGNEIFEDEVLVKVKEL
jgi:hypothetical protein